MNDYFIRVNMTDWNAECAEVSLGTIHIRVALDPTLELSDEVIFKVTGFVFADGRKLDPAWDASRKKIFAGTYIEEHQAIPDLQFRFVRKDVIMKKDQCTCVPQIYGCECDYCYKERIKRQKEIKPEIAEVETVITLDGIVYVVCNGAKIPNNKYKAFFPVGEET